MLKKQWCEKGVLLFVVLIFLLLSLWRYSDVLKSENHSLTNQGDGLGTIAGVFTVSEQITKFDSSYLFSDSFYSDRSGGALSSPSPFSQFWKLTTVSLSTFLSPNNVHDTVGMVGFFLACLFGFFLCQYFKLDVYLSLILAIAIASLDVTVARSDGHLFGLGVFFVPIIVVLFTAKAGVDPTVKNVATLALLHTLNFNVNEYYGFFGIFFTSSLLVAYWALYFSEHNFAQLVKVSVIGCLVFVLSMSVVYPNMVGNPLINLFVSSEGFSSSNHHVHSWESFQEFSVENVASIFSPANSFFISLINAKDFEHNLWEMTYRIGLVLPVSVFFLLCVLFVVNKREALLTSKKLFVWSIPATVMLLLSISPKFTLSLVPLTYIIAPMFRVATRALLYFDLICFVMLILVTVPLLKELRGKLELDKRVKEVLLATFSICVGLLVYSDVSSIGLKEKMPSLALPNIDVYKVIAEEPDGLLLELPYFSPVTSTIEDGYLYTYNRIAHKKPIVNLIYGGSNNVEHRGAIHNFSLKVNTLNERVLKSLVNSGIKYIAVKNHMPKINELLEKTAIVNKVGNDGITSIYKVRVEDNSERGNDVWGFIREQYNLDLSRCHNHSIIDFSNNEIKLTNVELNGFSHREPNGIWTLGDFSTIKVEFPPKEVKAIKLIFSNSFSENRHLPTNIKVGDYTTDVVITNTEVEIPVSMEMQKEPAHIIISPPRPTAPSDIIKSTDSRILGVKLRYLLFMLHDELVINEGDINNYKCLD
jgi:hypothetical protein